MATITRVQHTPTSSQPSFSKMKMGMGQTMYRKMDTARMSLATTAAVPSNSGMGA